MFCLGRAHLALGRLRLVPRAEIHDWPSSRHMRHVHRGLVRRLVPRLLRFYDHVHTTGLDVPQAPYARAALTLGSCLRSWAYTISICYICAHVGSLPDFRVLKSREVCSSRRLTHTLLADRGKDMLWRDYAQVLHIQPSKRGLDTGTQGVVVDSFSSNV